VVDAAEKTGPAPAALRELARRALAEDVGRGDVTSELTVGAEAQALGRILAREDVVVYGLEAARAVFLEADPALRFSALAQEGGVVRAGAVVAEVEGLARSILAAERVALNLLMRLSGIATLTKRYAQRVEGTGARIADTRKTTPGLRALEKAAVRAGGGTNHRFGLDDGILIKDNHVALAGGVGEAVRRAKANAPHLLKVEIEVESPQELEEALEGGADAILLDNMTPGEVRRAVAIVREKGPEVLVEVAGGVNERSARAYARAGADLVSVGALTHSAPAADLSLEVEPC
jgi:nicotinate-nucleotide pyrophosphorylase (carboxylating)